MFSTNTNSDRHAEFEEEKVVSDNLADTMQGEVKKSPNKSVPTRREKPRNEPDWLANDRKVLRFFAQFKEPVVESSDENVRVRYVHILFQLDNGQMQFKEPKSENSGIPQGVLLKREFYQHDDTGANWKATELKAGTNITLFKRVYRVYDCDPATKAWFTEKGLSFGTCEDLPEDQNAKARMAKAFKEAPADKMEVKGYIEKGLGGGNPNGNLDSFLNNDRKVLCQDCVWDDKAFGGGLKQQKLNFQLSDSTVEVKEKRTANSGIDPQPLLLKRQKLPKKVIRTHQPGSSLEKEDMQTVTDLRLGETVTVHSKDMVLLNCDDFTYNQWIQNYGLEMERGEIKEKKPVKLHNPLPARNGFGTDEDSIGSVYALQPKVPKKDFIKMFNKDQVILRFGCKLVSSQEDDSSRNFTLSFFGGDDTIQVIEPVTKNQGLLGGKIVGRGKHKNPNKPDTYFSEQDMCLGDVLLLNGRRFLLDSADEWTLKQMDEHPDEFPQANTERIVDKIQEQLGKKTGKGLDQLFDNMDVDDDNKLSFKEFQDGMVARGVELTHHEGHTLFRRLDKNKDKSIDKAELKALFRM